LVLDEAFAAASALVNITVTVVIEAVAALRGRHLSVAGGKPFRTAAPHSLAATEFVGGRAHRDRFFVREPLLTFTLPFLPDALHSFVTPDIHYSEAFEACGAVLLPRAVGATESPFVGVGNAHRSQLSTIGQTI
jgi:hypothetical protein